MVDINDDSDIVFNDSDSEFNSDLDYIITYPQQQPCNNQRIGVTAAGPRTETEKVGKRSEITNTAAAEASGTFKQPLTIKPPSYKIWLQY